MRARVLVPLAALVAGAAAVVIATRPGADLAAEFERRLAEMTPAAPGEPVTEADLAHLPPPVAEWLLDFWTWAGGGPTWWSGLDTGRRCPSRCAGRSGT